jgi:hypothetical protein
MLEKITDNLYVKSECFSNSKNWGHLSIAIYNGNDIAKKKIVYLNRTWEARQFDTVKSCLLDILDTQKILPLYERVAFARYLKAKS